MQTYFSQLMTTLFNLYQERVNLLELSICVVQSYYISYFLLLSLSPNVGLSLTRIPHGPKSSAGMWEDNKKKYDPGDGRRESKVGMQAIIYPNILNIQDI